jgi:hypothetical protein
MRALTAVTLLLGLLGCPGEDAAAKRAQDRLKKAEAEKAEKKKRDAQLDAARQKARLGEPSFGAPWDDATLLVPDSPCPLGLWALLPGPAPGGDKAEIESNEADRGQWIKALKSESYMVKLRAPDGVVVAPYDAAKGTLPLEVSSSMECTDAAGRITIAWSTAKVRLTIPMGAAAAAKDWADTNGAALWARVVFKLGAGESNGGKRVLRADLVGVRVATDQEKNLVVEKKGT